MGDTTGEENLFIKAKEIVYLDEMGQSLPEHADFGHGLPMAEIGLSKRDIDR